MYALVPDKMALVRYLPVLFACFVLASCEPASPSRTVSTSAPPPMAAPTPDQASIEADKKQLATLQIAYDRAKASYSKSKSASAKDALIVATVRLGTATMSAPSLPPREKYPNALRYYREALALDPSNKEAANNKAMIEDIYRGMGRPIPT